MARSRFKYDSKLWQAQNPADADGRVQGTVNATGKAGKRKGRRLRRTASTVRTYYISREQFDNAPQNALAEVGKVRGSMRVKTLHYRKED